MKISLKLVLPPFVTALFDYFTLDRSVRSEWRSNLCAPEYCKVTRNEDKVLKLKKAVYEWKQAIRVLESKGETCSFDFGVLPM